MDEYIRTIENIQDGVLSVFLGAGASIQSGVPSAGDMVWEFKRNQNSLLKEEKRQIGALKSSKK